MQAIPRRATRRSDSAGREAACLSGRKEAGFTIIELMIVIAIFAIAMAAAMPSYNEWIQNTHIRNAAESLSNGIQRARAEAVSRNVTVTFSIAGDNFWTITDTGADETIESRPLAEIPASVTVTPTPDATTTLTFNNLGVRTDGSVQIDRIDVDSSALAEDVSRDLRIVIVAGGSARMCDPNPAIADTDPRHCPE